MSYWGWLYIFLIGIFIWWQIDNWIIKERFIKMQARHFKNLHENEMITTCDICGKEIIGVENFINAGDKVVCSEDCKQTAIGQFRHWENTPSHNWKRKEIK
jgi:hypothetical protein